MAAASERLPVGALASEISPAVSNEVTAEPLAGQERAQGRDAGPPLVEQEEIVPAIQPPISEVTGAGGIREPEQIEIESQAPKTQAPREGSATTSESEIQGAVSGEVRSAVPAAITPPEPEIDLAPESVQTHPEALHRRAPVAHIESAAPVQNEAEFAKTGFGALNPFRQAPRE